MAYAGFGARLNDTRATSAALRRNGADGMSNATTPVLLATWFFGVPAYTLRRVTVTGGRYVSVWRLSGGGDVETEMTEAAYLALGGATPSPPENTTGDPGAVFLRAEGRPVYNTGLDHMEAGDITDAWGTGLYTLAAPEFQAGRVRFATALCTGTLASLGVLNLAGGGIPNLKIVNGVALVG